MEAITESGVKCSCWAIIIIGLIVIWFAIFYGFYESFEDINKEGFFDDFGRTRPNTKTQLGFIHGTPSHVQNIMKGLNEIGAQTVADSEYDTIDPKLLN
jgi:hypothetical protein